MGIVYGVGCADVTIWYGLDRVPDDLGETVVTIGVFDGVHRGHQELMRRTVQTAEDLHAESVMITFDPHPTVVFLPEAVPPLLTPVEERARQAELMGIDHVVVIAFTPEISSWSPEEYIQKALIETLHAQGVIIGTNFTFGKDASGTSQTMKEIGERKGLKVDVVELLEDGDHVVCSTWIRDRLAQGDMEAVSAALGRAFTVTGEVEHGAGRGGRALGFPTANQYFPEKFALPAEGVYAGYLEVLPRAGEDADAKVGTMPVGQPLPAAISVGHNPTFGHEPLSVESFVLDHEADLYGREVRVSFIQHLRGQETYDSMDELIAAIDRDVQHTREACARR